MASIPPPQGMSETDYEAIEAAVTETVRGRWFLTEYARRNRLAETRQLLDAMARLETVVLTGQTALPSADPSIRLMIQRIKEIASRLNGVAGDLREAGVEDHLVQAVDAEARAVAGMMRSAAIGGPVTRPEQPRSEQARAEQLRSDLARLDAPARTPPDEPPKPASDQASRMPRMPRAEPLVTSPRHPLAPEPAGSSSRSAGEGDPRLAALAELDSLTLARKLALFT